MNTYYRDSEGKMHVFEVDTDSYVDAIYSVRTTLYDDSEDFNEPILCVIDGEKE